jgi:hypothetical protein
MLIDSPERQTILEGCTSSKPAGPIRAGQCFMLMTTISLSCGYLIYRVFETGFLPIGYRRYEDFVPAHGT